MSEREMVLVALPGEIEASDADGYFGERATFNASEMLEWLTSRLPEVPEEYRGTARVNIHATCWCDESRPEIEGATVKYRRPETDEEVAARLARDAQYLRETDERERREFERLAAKFGKR